MAVAVEAVEAVAATVSARHWLDVEVAALLVLANAIDAPCRSRCSA
jgi:hypothetical protein